MVRIRTYPFFISLFVIQKGRTFTLSSANLTDINAPAIKGGLPGQYTKESGFLAFFEVIHWLSLDSRVVNNLVKFQQICDLLKMGATLVWDNEQMVPYAYAGDQWVSL